MYKKIASDYGRLNLFLIIIALALLPFSLNIKGIFELIFISLLMLNVLLIVANRSSIKRKILEYKTSIFYATFLLSIMWSSLYGFVIGSTTLNDMIIGVIPFLFLSVYWIVLLWVKNIFQVSSVFKCVVLAGSIVSSRVVTLFIINSVAGNYLSRVTFAYPKATTPLTIIATIISIYFILYSDSKKEKWIYFAVFTLNLLGVLLTFTRSMILLLALALIIYYALNIKLRLKRNIVSMKKSLFIFLAISLIPILILKDKLLSILSLLFIRFNSLFSGLNADPNSIARLNEVKISLAFFQSRPIFGFGIGYLFQPGINGELHGYTHNIFSYLIVTMGMVGVLVYTILIIYILADLLHIIKKVSKNEIQTTTMLITIFVSLITLMLYSQFFAVFRTIEYNFVFATLLAAFSIIKYQISQSV
jgi:O-antigen ligase